MIQYKEILNKEEVKNVCIDFDGVIHDDYEGFGDGTIYGPLIEGADDAIRRLAQTYNVIVFTAKAKPDRPLINGKTGTELVWEWLKKYNLDTHIKEVTCEKPRALTYIDDKAIRFENWSSTLKHFKNYYEIK